MGRTVTIDAPWDFTVGHNTTVGFRVWKRAIVAGKESFDPEDLSAARYSMQLRGRLEGAAVYLFDKNVPKVDGANGYFEGYVDAFVVADVGKTLVCWAVLIDTGLAPGGATKTGSFEEILCEFTRTIRPGLAAV